LLRLGDDLAGADAAKAYSAVWAMASDPTRSLPFFRERLRPVAPTDREDLRRLIAELDSPQFDKRESAMRQLGRLEERAEAALRKALTDTSSLETRRRLELLIKQIEACDLDPSPERRRSLRAVEALEHMATAQARQLVAELAAGAPGAWLTREAQATLSRLRGRTTDPYKRP
jgi:hypothetical protein